MACVFTSCVRNFEIKMQKHESAFTLIELMITLAVAAVVLTIGVPGFGRIIENNQLATTTNSFVSSLTFARSEAVKRNEAVTICRGSVSTNCAAAAGYEQGWLVFIDNNASSTYDASDELLRVNEALPSNFTLRGNGQYQSVFRYTSKGRVAAINGRFVLCKGGDLEKSRAVFIETTGRTRLAPLNSTGTPLDGGGTPITSCTP